MIYGELGRYPLETFKINIFILEESPKAVNYKVFKDSFSSEAYLDILDNKNLVEFCRFRTTNHKLPIEAGRWLNTSRQNRNCTLCKNNELGDEFHFILECKFFEQERKNYI